ncbi:hypothetical protein C8R44DRAFT_727252 [Mycena epipterygia]|nr:hypothetical protein C8R44DRAFT_727252 [Mycena epipterygia]
MPRGKPLSDDLRGVIINMGMTQDIPNIMQLTGVKRQTIEQIFADYRNKGCASTCAKSSFLTGLVRHSPDIYVYPAELQEVLGDRLGVEVQQSKLCRSLQWCGFAMKKLTQLALERSEAKCTAFHYDYGSQYTAKQTVFVDESSFDRRTSMRGKAWALSRERAQRKCFFVRGRQYSPLPTLAIITHMNTKVQNSTRRSP